MVDYRIKGTKLPNYVGKMNYKCSMWKHNEQKGSVTFDLSQYVSYGSGFYKDGEYIFAESLRYIGKNYFMFKLSDLIALTPKEEFVLPERWAIRHYPETLKWIQENAEVNGHCIKESFCYYYPCDRSNSNYGGYIPSGYTEITLEQFRKYVLGKQAIKPKLIGYQCMSGYAKLAWKLVDKTSSKVFLIREFDESFKVFKDAGVLDIWFTPIYEDVEEIRYFGDVKFTIKGSVAETEYGKITKNEVKAALDYIENPPKLAGHFLSVLNTSGERVGIGTSFGFGCQRGTFEELKAIYNAFK